MVLIKVEVEATLGPIGHLHFRCWINSTCTLYLTILWEADVFQTLSER